MDSALIRQKFLNFFAAPPRSHIIIPSAPLIPENDPTVLFTTAGMHPLVPFLLGEPHPAGRRLASIQKCLRTVDIDEVGDITHLTFFEMLGNWSLGDYFKKEAISWSLQFLTEQMGLDPSRLSVTCFAGDTDAPRDEEAAAIWRSLGIPEQKIHFYPKQNNWWGPAGQTGPTGPCTEIFYDRFPEQPYSEPEADEARFIEVWNNVFMEYNKTADGRFEPLSQKNVDTGLGFERLTMFMQNVASPYETDLFSPLMTVIDQHATAASPDPKARRIVADHLRTAVFLLAEKLSPSNVEQGYVLRRLLRRAIRYFDVLAIKDPAKFLTDFSFATIAKYQAYYPELAANAKFISDELLAEYQRFQQVIAKGLHEFSKLASQVIANSSNQAILSGPQAFMLYDTYGFPIEMTQELAAEQGIAVDLDGFAKAFSEHQNLSRSASGEKFAGGLADHSTQTTAYHTATHLLHAALRQVLGSHVEQRGSNLTAERLRFDFSHPEKMTTEQIAQVEKLVNEAIAKHLTVTKEEMSLSDALAAGAIGLFTEKYGERVSVYTIADPDTKEIYSREICGGPHVHVTADLGHFRIIKEESSSAGVRRLKAALEK
jgi:alanyl-tRNA synthetase